MSARHYMQFLRFYGLYLLPLCHCCRRLHDGIRRRGWEDVAVLCGLGRWLLGPRKRIHRQGAQNTQLTPALIFI